MTDWMILQHYDYFAQAADETKTRLNSLEESLGLQSRPPPPPAPPTTRTQELAGAYFRLLPMATVAAGEADRDTHAAHASSR